MLVNIALFIVGIIIGVTIATLRVSREEEVDPFLNSALEADNVYLEVTIENLRDLTKDQTLELDTLKANKTRLERHIDFLGQTLTDSETELKNCKLAQVVESVRASVPPVEEEIPVKTELEFTPDNYQKIINLLGVEYGEVFQALPEEDKQQVFNELKEYHGHSKLEKGTD